MTTITIAAEPIDTPDATLLLAELSSALESITGNSGASSFEALWRHAAARRISLLFVQGFRVWNTSGFMMGNLARFVAVCCFGT